MSNLRLGQCLAWWSGRLQTMQMCSLLQASLLQSSYHDHAVVADLATWGLLGGRRTLVVTPARFLGRFLMAWRTNGRKKVSGNEKGLFEAVEGVAPLHESQFQCAELCGELCNGTRGPLTIGSYTRGSLNRPSDTMKK